MTYDHNQTVVPEAFQALHASHGRPRLSRAETEARHAACEDIALHTAQFLSERGVEAEDSSDALGRCLTGLEASDGAASPAEAEWIVRRVAELMDWPQPDVLPR